MEYAIDFTRTVFGTVTVNDAEPLPETPREWIAVTTAACVPVARPEMSSAPV